MDEHCSWHILWHQRYVTRSRVATDTRRVALCSSTMVCSWCSFRLRLIIKQFIVLLDNSKLLSNICKYVLRIQRSLRWNQARGHNLADDERIVTKDCWALSDLMVRSWTPGDHGNSEGWGQRWCTIRWCKFWMLLRRPVHLQQLHSTIASRLRKSIILRSELKWLLNSIYMGDLKWCPGERWSPNQVCSENLIHYVVPWGFLFVVFS